MIWQERKLLEAIFYGRVNFSTSVNLSQKASFQIPALLAPPGLALHGPSSNIKNSSNIFTITLQCALMSNIKLSLLQIPSHRSLWAHSQ